MQRTLVVSATNVLARGFLLVPTDRVARDGVPANGLFAVARAIRRVLAFKAPARAVAIVEANPPPATWPAILTMQLAPLRDLLAVMGIPVVDAPDEPSVVASYAAAARAAGDDVMVVGVDKRYAQLVDEHLWWYDANKDARYTSEVVYKRFGVPPSQVAEWLGLVGDDDQLPGIAGIGAKGATGLLAAHGTVAVALALVDALKGRAGNALRAAGDALPRELARARLATDRPLPVPLTALAYTPSPLAPQNARFDALGFVELLVADDTRIPVEILETPEAVTAALATLGAAGPITLHALLEDPAPLREALVGIALASGDGTARYVPVGGAAWIALVPWLADPAAPKRGHDLTATIVVLARLDIALAGIASDSAAASHLANPSNWAPHDLSVTAKHVLGRALPADDLVRGVGQRRKAWAQLPMERAAEAAGLAAEASAAIWTALAPSTSPGLVAEYLELTSTTARMELTGLTVDADELAKAEAAFATFEAELTTQIEALAGHPFNINSTKQLGAVLFAELKLPVASHTKTGWSTATEALEKIEHAHPIVPRVIRWRLLRRLRDSWIIALRKCIDTDGRVHSRFHPARSFSGHLVNTAPDLARVPGRTPEMAMIRRAFVAPPGSVLMSVDFQQLGLYVIAHLTRDPALVEPLRARADLHALTASAVFEKPITDITLTERQVGKVINFATFAGQGASALALQLGVPAAQAKEWIARFDRRYARVRAFQDEQLRLARAHGYIVTLAGRHWPIGGLESLDPHDRSYAERLARRATHEASVADVARKALRDAERALRAAGLAAAPVHAIVDEVLFEVPVAELPRAARVAASAMRAAFALEVPLVVGVEAGATWADLEPVTLDLGRDAPP